MKKLNTTKEKVIIFLISGSFAFLASNNIFHIQDIITFSLPIMLSLVLLIIISFLVFQAGLIAIKSLVFVAAELSLIIFLAQSYCAPGVTRTITSNNALTSLIFLGLSYVIYLFLTDMYHKLDDQAKKFKAVDGKWSGEAIVMFTLLLIFVVSFTVMIFEVVSPIVLGLCVYK